jgi:nucleoid DNA-binding protein
MDDSLNRPHVIRRMRELFPDWKYDECSQAYDRLFKTLFELIADGNQLKVINFGVFSCKFLKAEKKIHRISKVQLDLPPRVQVKFAASSHLTSESTKRFNKRLKAAGAL